MYYFLFLFMGERWLLFFYGNIDYFPPFDPDRNPQDVEESATVDGAKVKKAIVAKNKKVDTVKKPKVANLRGGTPYADYIEDLMQKKKSSPPKKINMKGVKLRKAIKKAQRDEM